MSTVPQHSGRLCPARRLLAAVALLGILLSGACATQTGTREPGGEPADFSSLAGTWEGKWIHGSDSGPITVTFDGTDTASYVVTDSNSAKSVYRWDADLQMDGDEMVVSARGVPRVERYPFVPGSGQDVLKGTYTYKGKPWGSITLHKQ